MTEASKAQKSYNEHDLQVLLDHAHNQKTSVADAFITQGSQEHNRALLKRSAKQAELKDINGDAGEKPSRKRAKKFDGDRDGPKYYQTMKGDMEKLVKRIPVTNKAFNAALAELRCVEEFKKASDPALQGFLRKLQFRMQVFNKWQNDDTVVLLHIVFPAKDGPAPVPTLHLQLENAAAEPSVPSVPVPQVVVVVVSVVAAAVAAAVLLLLLFACVVAVDLCCCCCCVVH